MFDFRKKLGLIALVCSIAGLASCGGGSGTDNEKVDLPVCNNFEVVLEDGTCGEPPELPACPEGQIRVAGICITPDKPAPVYTPENDQVVIYVNSKQKEAVFPLLNLHMWQSCGTGWAEVITDPKTGTEFSIAQTSGGGLTWPNGPFISSSEAGPLMHDPIYGAYFVLPVNETGSCGNFIVKDPVRAGAGDNTAQTNDLSIDIIRNRTIEEGPYDRMYFVILNDLSFRNSRVSASPICIDDVCQPYEKPLLAVSDVEAHWIDEDTILWNRDVDGAKIYKSAQAGMIASTTENDVMVGGSLFASLSSSRAMSGEEVAIAPHLEGYFAYDIATELSVNQIKAALKEELVILGVYDDPTGARQPVLDEDGEPVVDEEGNAVTELVMETVTIDGEEITRPQTFERGVGTRIQTARILDVLYADEAESETLGVAYNGNNVTVSVWAPTTQSAELRVFSGDPLRLESKSPMTLDAASGVWSFTGSKAELDRKFYRFRFNTYNPVSKKVEILEVTDPYSVGLSTNSIHSQFVNLNDADLKPAGWENEAPTVTSFESSSIYEVHIRDFSIDDESTPAAHRGKYLAFTANNSAPVNHLKSLKAAGLTHIHFLPSNDSSNINEDFSAQLNLDSYVFELCARVSPRNSAIVCNGAAKNTATLRSVLETYDEDSDDQRSLIESLRSLDGFNWGYDPQHFNAPEGGYATNSNGVTRIKEMRAMNQAVHNMGLRVVMDVVYPHTVSSGSEAANSVFDKVVPGYYYRKNIVTGGEENGTGAGPDTATENRMMAKFVKDSLVQWAAQYKVDGFRFDQSGFMPKSLLVDSLAAVQEVDPDTYFYAEAWTPGAGTSEARIGANLRATQAALAGTGIGTFNDRIRNPLQQLHIVNGQDLNPVRAGLVGNLTDFKILDTENELVDASVYGAYNLDPQESINYVEKHDNETLWDWMHRTNTALPEDTTLDERVRIHSLTLSVPVLSQGVPFFHMGSDLLRSKSMSPNSYDAGDWFNKVDFTKQSNNWAVGLPPELRDGITDNYVRLVFADTESKPAASDIEQSSLVFQEFMEISKSPLFSLTTATEVKNRIGFHDGGSAQVDNLIVMSINDGNDPIGESELFSEDIDPDFDAIVVIFNGTGEEISKKINTSTGFVLHPVQQNSADEIVKTASFEEANKGGIFTVPAYTTAVFVKLQDGDQGEGLAPDVTIDPPPPYDVDMYVRGIGTWDATEDNKLTYIGANTYQITFELEPGDYAFKVAGPGWENEKAFPAADTFIALGVNTVLSSGGSDIKLTIEDAGEYRFVLDANNDATPSLKIVNTDFFKTTPIYVRGVAGDWDTTDALINQLIDEGDGIYAVSMVVPANTHSFKIASSDYAYQRGISADASTEERTVPLDGTLVLQDVGGFGTDVGFVADITSTYKFAFNTLTDELTITDEMNIYKSEAMYVRGGLAGGWSAPSTHRLAYQGSGIYSVTLAADTAGSQNFKIANGNDDWAGTVLGANSGDEALTLGVAKTLTSPGENIAVTVVNGTSYTFTLDASDPDAQTVTVE